MHTRVCAVVVLSVLLARAPASAQGEGTWYVVPGRSDVPVFVNPLGYDASYTVVEGDFGLGQPVQVNPHIVGGPLVPPVVEPRRYYFPHSDRRPGYGRYEVVPPPNHPKPPPQQTYIRSWGTSSDPLPASLDPPTPMVIQPYVGGWGGGPWGPRGGGHHR
jgi:hypothetical protein